MMYVFGWCMIQSCVVRIVLVYELIGLYGITADSNTLLKTILTNKIVT